MSLRMASPVRRQNSPYFQFRKRVPADIKLRARGKEAFFLIGSEGTLVRATVGDEIVFSLRTHDPAEAKARQAQASAQLAQFFAAVRNEPKPLSHRQIVALSGEVYRLYVDRFSEDPGAPEEWAVFKAFNRAAREGRLLGVPRIKAGFQNNDDTLAASLGDDLTAGVDALPTLTDTELTAIMDIRFGDLADGVHVMQIRPAPDAGSIKNATSERTVPIHPKMIEEGFLDFVASKGKGPLFYRRSSGDSDRKHASKGVSNHLAAWIRKQGFRDPRKAPNHALRHWWKSAAVAARIPEGVADHLQGHAGRTEADTYRHYSLTVLADAVSAIALPIDIE